MGPRDVCGYVLDPCGGERRGRPTVRLAVSVGMLCVIAGLVIAGGWCLKRAASRAREESDALVERLRQKIEQEEVEHV